MDDHLIRSEAELESLFGTPAAPSIAKVTQTLTPSYRRIIEASPFCTIATSGAGGLDCSPRGDHPGFVRVADESKLLMPDRRGNNRLDTLRNILRDPRVALLFFVPGLSETLRVNGSAVLSREPALCESFEVQGKIPQLVTVVKIESVYFQCARALIRSGLWNPASYRDPATLPSVGTMLTEASNGAEGGREYDERLPERIRTTLY